MADCIWGDKIIDNPFLLIQPTYGVQIYNPQQLTATQLSAARSQQQGLQNTISCGMSSASRQNSRIRDWQNAGLSQAQIEANLRFIPLRGHWTPPRELTQEEK